MRRNKGISLIVLVITIIVMIILAGSIIITLSNSGIINKANEAVEMSNEAQLKEMATAELIINGWYSGQDFSAAQVEALKKQFGEQGVNQLRKDTLVLSKDGTTITLYSTGDMVKGEVELWDGTSVEVPEIKEGNWYIYTPAQFKFLAGYVNNASEAEGQKTLTAEQMALVPQITENTIVNLMADLDMGARQKNGEIDEGTEWMPIGLANTDSAKFLGIFDGKNHVIKGIYVSREADYGGIFGNAHTIKNLTIKDSYIKAANGAGGIVAALRNNTAKDCVLENCHNINTQVITTKYMAGGVVGQFSGKSMKDCTNTGSVSAGKSDSTSNSYVGGVVGSTTEGVESITNCSNAAGVSGTGKCIGGIIGNAGKGVSITACTNSGNVSGIKEKNAIVSVSIDVGGIVGILRQNVTITNCINNGKILNSFNNTGGIVGALYPSCKINSCINNGNIISEGERTAGIAGDTYQNNLEINITNCINNGNVESDKLAIGGIVGVLCGTVENCYNTGNIKSTGSSTEDYEMFGVGGIVGGTMNVYTSIIKNTYNIGTISVQGKGVVGIGGIVGFFSAKADSVTASNNYNIGRIVITGENATGIGGILGTAEELETYTLSNNYYMQGITNATLNEYGDVKTSAEMKTDEFVEKLNEGLASEAWTREANKNSGYPVLIGLK